MKLYIVGVAIEARGQFVAVTFTLKFESIAPQAKEILKSALINETPMGGVVEIGVNAVQCTLTCATVAKLRECVEAVSAVESEVEAKLAELERVEKIARAAAGYYVEQVLASRLWDEEEDNE